MSAPLWPKAGDTVLVRGTVLVDGNGRRQAQMAGHHFLLAELEIAAIEKPTFRVGDRVIAEGHAGVILAINPLGNLLWVAPDSGNQRPWTVDSYKCIRAPAPAPSAEILPFQELPDRPCDSEDTAA